MVPAGSINVSSARVRPKYVTTGPLPGVGERVGVRDLVCVGVAERVGVGVRVAVRTALGVGLTVAVRVRVAVKAGVGVCDADGEGNGVGEYVAVVGTVALAALRVAVGVAVASGRDSVAEGVDVALRVGVNVENGVAVDDLVGDGGCEGVGVRVALRVRVAEGSAVNDGTTVGVGEGGRCAGVAVGVRVGVGEPGKGPGPTRTRICASGPKFPATSRTTALINVSPSLKMSARDTCKQNCTCVPSPANAPRPKRSCVHAKAGEVATVKLQPASLIASVIARNGRKSGGCTAGTPPSHTARLPSPSGRLTSTHRSGRTSGRRGSLWKTFCPTLTPLIPGRASMTTLKPCPAGRAYTGTPCTTSCCENGVPSALAKPKKVITGPSGGGAVTAAATAGKSAAVSLPSRLASSDKHGHGG